MPVLLPDYTSVEVSARREEDRRAVLEETLSGVDSRLRGVVADGHVGELAHVGRGRGADGIPRLEGVRVKVVTSALGDGIGKVPCVSKSKVVRVVGETHAVLIEQVSERDRVGTGGRGQNHLRQSGVVGLLMTVLTRELSLESNIPGLVGEAHNSVGHADVKARARGNVLEGSILSLLNLVNQDIARGITHLDTLVVVDHSVVSVGLNAIQLRRQIVLSNTGNVGGERANVVRAANQRSSGVNHHQLGKVAEVISDLHVIEGQSSNGQSDTRVLAKEEG